MCEGCVMNTCDIKGEGVESGYLTDIWVDMATSYSHG